MVTQNNVIDRNHAKRVDFRGQRVGALQTNRHFGDEQTSPVRLYTYKHSLQI